MSDTSGNTSLFTETNPDKGTETVVSGVTSETAFSFTETNPDKGTETPEMITHQVSCITVYRN